MKTIEEIVEFANEVLSDNFIDIEQAFHLINLKARKDAKKLGHVLILNEKNEWISCHTP